ncbi:hypothetical protein Vi05172_g1433 [Venturia inaequalis]|nr:hypothetical protein Vi05172_g1433 [Venturia inaequalis]
MPDTGTTSFDAAAAMFKFARTAATTASDVDLAGTVLV